MQSRNGETRVENEQESAFSCAKLAYELYYYCYTVFSIVMKF